MTQDKLLEILYPYIPAKAIGDYLGWTPSQVYNRTSRIGVKKDPKVKQQMAKRMFIK